MSKRIRINKSRAINALFALACILAVPDAHAGQVAASPDMGGSVPAPGSAAVMSEPFGVCWNKELTRCSKVPAGTIVRIVRYEGELIVIRVINKTTNKLAYLR